MTREEFITFIRNRSDALADANDDSVGAMVDSALSEYSHRRPQQVALLEQPINDEGVYDLPDDIVDVIDVRTSDFTHREIDFDVIVNADTNVGKLYLGLALVSSTDRLMGMSYYESPTLANYQFVGQGYTSYDLFFSREIAIENIKKTDLNIVALFVEHLGYERQSSMVENFVSISDKDESGAETKIEDAAVGSMYKENSKDKLNEFNRKLRVIAGLRGNVVDSTYRQYGYSSFGISRNYARGYV